MAGFMCQLDGHAQLNIILGVSESEFMNKINT